MQTRFTPANLALFAALTLIWGSSYILIKKALLAFSPLELAATRVSISMLASIPFLPKAFKNVPKKLYVFVLLTGLLGSLFPAFLFAFSLTHLSSSINGIINSLSPLFTLLTGLWLFKAQTNLRSLSGVAIGFLGAIVLIIFNSKAQFNVDAKWAILPILATLCYGLSGNIVKAKLHAQTSIYITAMAMLFVGTPCLFYSAPMVVQKITAHPFSIVALLYIAVLSIFGTFIAWMLYYKLVQKTDALFASSVTYVIPIVATAWGFADGEILGFQHFIGLVLILTGVWLVSKGNKM